MQPSRSGARRIVPRPSKCYTCSIIDTLPSHEEGGDSAEQENLYRLYEHVFDPEYIDLLEWLSQRAGDELEEIEAESIRRILLEHVGIANIDRCFDVLSPELKSDITHVYNLSGSFAVYDVRLELEEQLFKKLSVSRGGIDGLPGPGNSTDDPGSFRVLQNELYQVIDGSLIDAVANTTLWRRTLGIPQLGWKNNYPVENIHSRGAHELFLTMNMSRVLQSLYDKCPDQLLKRLRHDFSDMNFYDSSMTDDHVAKLAAELAALVGMTHDIFQPAGGDMMKHVMGMDEEADASKLLEQDDPRVKELRVALEEFGIDDGHIAFAVSCIQGNSTSLVGEMIHAHKGDCLDQDRIAYTLQDLFSIGMLGPALPRMVFDESSLKSSEIAIETAIGNVVKLLNDPDMHAVGPAYIGGSPASLSLLDVSGDYILDADSQMVCTRPDKLAWLAVLRSMMLVEFYQGAKLRGQEHEMSVLFGEIADGEDNQEVLTPDNLLAVNNRGLEQQLRTLGNVAVNNLLDKIDKIFYDGKYESAIVDLETLTDDEWFVLPLSFKPGLDSLVMDGADVKTLGNYIEDNPELPSCKLMLDLKNRYQNKKRVIRKIDEAESDRKTWFIV